MFSKVMFATLFVSDQDKALDDYTTNFGLEKMAIIRGQRAVSC